MANPIFKVKKLDPSSWNCFFVEFEQIFFPCVRTYCKMMSDYLCITFLMLIIKVYIIYNEFSPTNLQNIFSPGKRT